MNNRSGFGDGVSFILILFSVIIALTCCTYFGNRNTRVTELEQANFEQVGDDTYRRKTIDGWELITHLDEIPTIVIPDPEHKWVLPTK